jgi:hypothetical protein
MKMGAGRPSAHQCVRRLQLQQKLNNILSDR